MILRSITVQNWRCFLDETRVGPFDEGLNVIHAPNATGKSTLFDAMTRCFVDSHRVSGQKAETLRPRGRSLAPVVTVEFASGGDEYRLTKRFLDSPASRLERLEEGRFVPLHENDAADDHVRDLLATEAPARGLSDRKHWGMAQALWVPQEGMAMAQFSEDSLSDLQGMLGAQISTAADGEVESLIGRRYREIFTPSGKLRGGKAAPPLVTLTGRLEEARQEQRQAQERVLEFEETSRLVQDQEARRSQCRADSRQVQRVLAQARLRQREHEKLVSEAGRLEDRLQKAEALHQRAAELVAEMQQLEKSLLAMEQEREKLHKEHETRVRELQGCRERTLQRQIQLDGASEASHLAQQAGEVAGAARRLMDHQGREKALESRMSKIDEVQKGLEDLLERRSQLVAPDQATVDQVREIRGRLAQVETSLRAMRVTVEITPRADGAIEVEEGVQTGVLRVSAGKPTAVEGESRVRLAWQGVGTIRARGPVGNVEALSRERSELERGLQELTEGYGSHETGPLQDLARQASSLDQEIRAARVRIRDLLESDTREQLQQERGKAQAGVKEILDAHPAWRQDPPDPDLLDREAHKAVTDAKARVTEATRQWQSAHKAQAGAEESLATLTARREELERNLQGAQARLEEIESDGLAQRERIIQRDRLALDVQEVRDALAEARRRLEGYASDPGDEVTSLEGRLQALEQAERQASEKLIRAQERLDALARSGPQEQAARATERVQVLERQVGQEQLRVDAIELLFNVHQSIRQEGLRSVAGPVRRAATRTLQRIAGRRIGRIEVGADMMPGSVGEDDPLSMELLSGGEREQVYLALRLALARLLASDERQLVVLDDVLTATDEGRLARIRSVLEEASHDLQILILTCHPERYVGVPSALRFDLEEILESARG